MSKKKVEPPMALDMPFGEALERFIGVEPRELHANVKKSKKKKPAGGKKPPADDKTNVESLSARRTRKRNHGR